MSRVTRSSKVKEHLELNDSYFLKQNMINRRKTKKQKSKDNDNSSQISQLQELENLKQSQKSQQPLHLQEPQNFQQLQKFKEPVPFKEPEIFKEPKYFREPKKTYPKKKETKQITNVDYDAWKQILNPTIEITEVVQKKQIKPSSNVDYQITIVGLNRIQYFSKQSIMEICPSIPYKKITMKINNAIEAGENSMKVCVRIKDQAHMLKFKSQAKILFPKLIIYVREKNANEQ